LQLRIDLRQLLASEGGKAAEEEVGRIAAHRDSFHGASSLFKDDRGGKGLRIA
jgi:hypothetical protein